MGSDRVWLPHCCSEKNVDGKAMMLLSLISIIINDKLFTIAVTDHHYHFPIRNYQCHCR